MSAQAERVRSTSSDHTNVLIRLPNKIIQHLKLSAKANFRSMTAEVTHRLAETVANESIDEHGCIVAQAKPAAK